jgi:uncharacterized membrane protein
MLAAGLTILLTLLYPLAIWLGHGQLEPRWMAGLLLLVALSRLPGLRLSATARWSAAGALLLAGAAAWSNLLMPLKLYPVLVNSAFLAVFGWSLAGRMPVIERLARLREPELPPFAVRYTRRVTQVWCLFFAVNGLLALATALWATDAVWSLYNGVIAYCLMGALFAGEWLTRRRMRRLHHA